MGFEIRWTKRATLTFGKRIYYLQEHGLKGKYLTSLKGCRITLIT